MPNFTQILGFYKTFNWFFDMAQNFEIINIKTSFFSFQLSNNNLFEKGRVLK